MPGEIVFTPLKWSDLVYLAPELALSAIFVLLIVLDLLLPKSASRLSIGWLTLGGLLLSFGLVAWRMIDMNASGGSGGQVIDLLGSSYRIDSFGSLLKLVFLGGTAMVVLLGLGSARDDNGITDKGEYFYLLLPAVTGAMMVASSGNLVTLYIGLELLSITSYVLVGLRRKSSLSAEAAFKYAVTGGIASAFVLFGMSYLYGVTGSVELSVIGQALPGALENYEALIYVGFAFMAIGFGVKIAAAPFHAWAPDVYQGAPGPVASFLAVISKGAALAVMLRIIYSTALLAGFSSDSKLSQDLFFGLLVMAASAMLVGVLAALKQMNMKRLLALSGVANAGYLLVPIGLSITIVHSNNVAEFIFYLIAYLLMTFGAFAVLSAISRAAGHDELRGFAGMYYRAPWTAAAMVIFILSLAGLPISAGFFGKLFILLGAANAKAYWLVAIMVVSSVISYYFYFGIARQMFMRSGGAAEDGGNGEIRIPVPTGIVIWVCAAATIALGLFPGQLMKWIDAVFQLQFTLLG